MLVMKLCTRYRVNVMTRMLLINKAMTMMKDNFVLILNYDSNNGF